MLLDWMVMSPTNLQVVANYFGANGTFQLLPAFNAERFTLRGRHKAPTEIPGKSCNHLTFYFSSKYVYRFSCFNQSPYPNRWSWSFSFDWSHSGSCSRNCVAHSILLFQVKIADIDI